MEVWQHIMDFTDRNAANVCRNQWNLNYLEVVGTAYEIPENIDDICKRIPKLKIETRTRYVKPRAKSTLGIHFKYTPPGRTQSSTKPFKDTVVSVKVVMPKVNDSTLVRNCICTCDRVQDRTRTEGDGDDDDITFDKLLDIVEHYDQGISKTSATVVRNVVRGYQGNITLNEYYVKKILVMLDSSDHIVLEAMLLLIHRLSRVSLNVKLLLEHRVLDDLIYLMLMGCTDELQTQAALCIAKLTEREEFSDWWMETMIISGTEALFDVLAAEEGTEDLRNAVLEAIVHLANNQKMASMLIDFGLENVIELTVCKTDEGKLVGSPITQRLATKALTNILSHSCAMVEQFLLKYQDVVERIVDILQYCACPQQKEAARFLATLTLFKSSIDSITFHHATQHLLWAMTCSHCRFVRELTSKAFKNITNHTDKDKLLNALSQLSLSQVNHSGTSVSSLTEILSNSSLQTNTSQIINAVKQQPPCTYTSLEKTMVEIIAVLTLCFQTDSLHLSGQSRAFRNDSLSGHRTSRTTENAINENYLSSLRVLTNTLVAIETLIRVNDKEENDKEATCSMETGANLNLAALFVQCGGLQFIDQLKFLSTKLQSVNAPSFHSIDPTSLPPKELISSIKNARTELIFHGPQRPNTRTRYPDFGFHLEELEFVQQTMSLLALLGQATAPDFHPAQEDVQVFEFRRRAVSKKRNISFRTSALVQKSWVQKSSLHVSDVEDKQASTRRKSSRKSSGRSVRSSVSMYSGLSTGQVNKTPLTVTEIGASTKLETIHYLKQSLLNSNVVCHLASWITCGVYDIQVSIVKFLRFLMHISRVPKQATEVSNGPIRLGAAPKSKNKSTYLGHLCVHHVIQYCGTYLLDLLKPPAREVLGRMSLMVIRESIVNGEADSRVRFVKLGCFAQIIDFIRGTEDEPETQSLGLVVVRSLVSSHQALKQLFYAHGGMSLVMALHEYKEGLVKEEAAFTLAAFSKGSSAVGKPRGTVTQKKKRQRRSGNDDDIWDHVLHKWQSQDKVAKLLKKFNVKY